MAKHLAQPVKPQKNKHAASGSHAAGRVRPAKEAAARKGPLFPRRDKTPKEPRAPKEIRVPEIRVRRPAHRVEKSEDGFQSAMLNKTLDRRFSASDLLLAVFALISLLAVYFLPTNGLARLLSFLVPFLLAGYSYLFEAFQEAFMGIVLGRELIVTIASLMAFCSGSWFGGAAIMVFLKICDLCLSFAESLQGEKVAELYALRPESADVVNMNMLSETRARDIPAGSVIEVDAGATVPIDGVVVEGTSVLDSAPLTHASGSYTVVPGSTAISGCVNVTAPVRIRTSVTQDESVCSAVIRAAENSWMHKASQEHLLQRILTYASPVIAVGAILLAIVPSVLTGEWRRYLLRAAILLTVSQSYSVVQSVKLAFDCAAARGAAVGVVFKGHDVIENFARSETMVFDKTGTVTEGEFRIKEVFPSGVTEEQLLFLAGAAELHSRHPLAKAIVAASGAAASDIEVLEVEETPGRGVSAFIDGRSVYVGNAALMDDHGIGYKLPSIPGSAIHVAVDDHYIGHIIVEDALRSGAFDAIEELRIAGVKTSVLLTGDVHSLSRKIASSLNFDMVKAELRPEDKCKSVEYLMSNRNVNTTLAFIGDGICDAEAIRLATVGVAFGCFDKPEAIEASDVAVLGGEIRTLPKAYRLARLTSRSVLVNCLVCLGVKLSVLALGALGILGLASSVALQTAAVIFETLNALRVLYLEDENSIRLLKKGRRNHE